MIVAGFVLLAVMIGIYVILDGYDLGIAAVMPVIARTSSQRAAAMASIGPFWNGNEVWLIATGGVLFALFPLAYASAFSGFYLPFTIVLWMLMFRGIALELRNHFSSELWHTFWDAAFTLASALLIFLFGVAFGNLVRGLPLDSHGYFLGSFSLLLNPYALGVGIFALLALAQHGLTFLALRVDGELAQRARGLLGRLWWAVLFAYLAITAATFALRNANASGTLLHLAPLVLLALLAVGAVRWFAVKGRAAEAFVASCLFLATLIAAGAATMFPYVLPAFPAGSGGISIFTAAPSVWAVAVTLAVTIPGLCAVATYSLFVARRMGGKLGIE